PARAETCPGCSRAVYLPALWGRDRRASFCSNRCRNKLTGARYRKRHPRREVLSARPCLICGKAFLPRREDAQTCGAKCRQQLYRNRKKGKQESLQMSANDKNRLIGNEV